MKNIINLDEKNNINKYKMSWKKLLSTKSQRPRKNINNNQDKKENNIIKDLRNDFERDYHRILSSPAFRRLQDKTQVYPLEKNDFVRTRLTHSIEVSSFAKSMAQSISDGIINNNLDDNFGVAESISISNIMSSAGLLHDIGNPPFGHFGEYTIREWFQKNLPTLKIKDETGELTTVDRLLTSRMKKDFTNFEGNSQMIRVASKLHFVVDENGMNLTYALLNTLIKYPVNSLDINKSSGDIKTKKLGYNLSEESLFWDIVKNTGTYVEEEKIVYRHPLTFILEAADDISYCTADLEDGVKKGFINIQKLTKKLEKHLGESHYLISDLSKYIEFAIKKGYDSPEIYSVQRWAVKVQSICIKNCVENYIKNYSKIMNGEFKTDLFSNTESEKILNSLRELAYEEVFSSKPIVKMEIAAKTIISDLLDKFVPAVLYWDTKYEHESELTSLRYISILSENQRHIYKYYSNLYEEECNKSRSMDYLQKEEEIYRYKLYLRLLLATDYISGMTDSFIKSLYHELNGFS